MKNILCCDCQYCGDKYSFPLPNDLIEVDSENPFIKHYYCCCGDSEFYGKDITNLDLTKCDSFEELQGASCIIKNVDVEN